MGDQESRHPSFPGIFPGSMIGQSRLSSPCPLRPGILGTLRVLSGDFYDLVVTGTKVKRGGVRVVQWSPTKTSWRKQRILRLPRILSPSAGEERSTSLL